MNAHANRLEDLPPSAKLVFKVLEYEGELRREELLEETLLPEVTLREAIRRLEEAGVVEDRYAHGDARKRVYSLS